MSPSSSNIFLVLFLQTLFVSIHAIEPTLHDVIIIGGGAAGITAFSELSRNKTDVLLLEAESRIGGRINTVNFGEGIVDLGAVWADKNALNYPPFEIAVEHGLLEKSEYSNNYYIYSNQKVIPLDLLIKFGEIFQTIYNYTDMREGITAAEFGKEKFAELTAGLTIPKEFPDLLEDMLEYLKHIYLCKDGTLDWNLPSARSDNINFGYEEYNWKKKGFKVIFDILLGNAPYGTDNLGKSKNILLNKKVTKILWHNSDDTVKVICNDSSQYNAKKVIFTPSLGVLKQKMNEIFDPILPESKRKSIENLGIGGIAKIYLEFEHDWLDRNDSLEIYNLIWDKSLRKSINNFKMDNDYIWITDLTTIISVEYNSKALGLSFDGLSVPFIETLDDKTLMDGIQFTLNQFFGQMYDIPKPIRMIRSNWYTNENFLGTYTYQTIESRKRKSHKDLEESLKNKNGKNVVFFAGEATSPVHYGMVHGAVHTGWREAEKVKKQLY